MNFDRDFIIYSVLSMFLAVMIIKFITMTIARIVKKSKSKKDDRLLSKIEAYYDMFPLAAGVVLTFAFLPDKFVMKDLIIQGTYFIGGILVIYKYLFKTILGVIKGFIQKKGGEL